MLHKSQKTHSGASTPLLLFLKIRAHWQDIEPLPPVTCSRTLHSVCKSQAKGIRFSWMTANERKHPPFSSLCPIRFFSNPVFYFLVSALHTPPRSTRPLWCANSPCSVPKVRTTIHWIPSAKDLCLSETHLGKKRGLFKNAARLHLPSSQLQILESSTPGTSISSGDLGSTQVQSPPGIAVNVCIPCQRIKLPMLKFPFPARLGQELVLMSPGCH